MITFGIPQNPTFNTVTSTGGIIAAVSATNGFQVFNTADQITNVQRLDIVVNSTTFQIGARTLGTASRVPLYLYAQESSASPAYSRLDLQTVPPHFRQGYLTTTTGVSSVNFGNTGTMVTFCNWTSTATSGTIVAFSVNPTYNQAAATTINTDFLINRTQTSVGSGAQLLFDAQVSTVSKFKIDNTGNIVMVGSITTGTPNGGVSGAWKTGAVRTSTALVVSTTNGIQVDVAGTLYTLAVLTTNP